ncbi:hypothetical protein [Bradyrhizobium sp.]|uniref:hypothetical protein n=1 Tax=Bradyrhizobium sp. TaxID=376 RepID=UPI0039E3BAE5
MNQWEFSLGEDVHLSMSSERGQVIGRAEYSDLPASYYVRYVAADGRQCESWFNASALVSATI